MAIVFGTEGWRGVMAEDFTFANVRRVARAIADYVNWEKGGRELVVGYDARFMSDLFAGEIARVLAANGIKVWLASKIATTPALSFAVRHFGAAGGIMVTASHNPPQYNGIKFKGEYGGPALPEMVFQIEKRISTRAIRYVGVGRGTVELFDPEEYYLGQLEELVDLKLILASDLHPVFDTMHGAAAGYYQRLFQRYQHQATEIRSERNPGFGGTNPEPIARNLRPLINVVLSLEAGVGLATDGDGDRVGAVDEKGNFVNPHLIICLLVRHLVENRGWRGGIVKTFSTTRLVERLATHYGLPVWETPIGFKHICDLMLQQDILLGGEESGGIGVKNHLPERDGVLTSLLLLEMMAYESKTLGELVADLTAMVGPHHYARVDITVDSQKANRLVQKLAASPPEKMAGINVSGVMTMDGLKLILGEEGWILFRPSGTEPLVRVYVEATSGELVEEIMKAGKSILLARFLEG